MTLACSESSNCSLFTNRSFLVSVKSEKYAFWVTLRPLGSMSQGEVKIHALQYSARRSRAAYIKLTLVFHHLPSVGPKQLCALAHLGCTREAGTLDYLINVQDVIIMQAGRYPKINKHPGCNKAMQVGIFKNQ